MLSNAWKISVHRRISRDFSTVSSFSLPPRLAKKVRQQTDPPKSKAKQKFPPKPHPKKHQKCFWGGFGRWTPQNLPQWLLSLPSGGGKTCPSPTTPPVDRPRVRVRCQVNPPRLRWSTGARWPCPVARLVARGGGKWWFFFPSKMIFPRFPFLLVGDFLGFF